MIALVLCCIIVLPFCSPVFAAGNDDSQTENNSRSMEEILSDYHTNSRQIEDQLDTGVNSRSVQTADTIRQDTVNELKAAGYEAYDVNPDTYTSVESELNTDLSDIGLDPESSYIIVISGEDTDNSPNSAGGSSRVITLPPYEYGGGDGSGTQFTYTYEGKTYQMRYLTVTADDNTKFGDSRTIELQSILGANSVVDVINSAISAYSSLGNFLYVGTLASILMSVVPELEPSKSDELVYTGGTNWTVTYTQIYDTVSDDWTARSSIEYVTMHYTITYSYYDSSIDEFTSKTTNDTYGRFYSDFYNDAEWRKSMAVQALNFGVRQYDRIESVDYKMEYPKGSGQKITVLTSQRWLETFGYEPE